ncbi:hypothetical protein [Chitinophaga sp. sic0106]|uniref:hypothetical protein n=1 Tax=Chitinophaga sp. sic0106 TaxID=2854785 RepID=UPI001C445978|nr:hypothetical protein [Chitinophaga sp. sic0106]MBV7530291.1 hypothetical protein [Chitinophaga sp. sic0106]
MRTVKTILLLNVLLFTAFGCKKYEKPQPEIITCISFGVSCVAVKYVGKSCQDVIQFVDPGMQAGFKNYTDTINNAFFGEPLNPRAIPHTIGVAELPDSVKDGNVFYMTLSGIDSSSYHPANCFSNTFILKYATLSKTPCAPGTEIKY